MRLKLWNSETGCTDPGYSILSEKDMNFAYLMKRGECNYYTKALNAKKAQARLVIVALGQENEDPSSVIPVGPLDLKHRKNLP